MNVPVTRRAFTLGTLAAGLGGPAILSLVTEQAAAQDATPSSATDLASYGFPTLDISITADSFEGVPSETAAGRYLVTTTVAGDVDSGAASFVRPPEGTSVDDLIAAVQGPGAEASPAAGSDEGGGAPPLVFYEATWPGGNDAPGGASSQAVFDLGPGDWMVWNGDPEVDLAPVTMTVTGEMPADLTEPDADVTITFVDFAISVEGNLTAGDHIARIENQGAEPHFVDLMKGPDGLTDADVTIIVNAMAAPPDGTPPALPYNPDTDFSDVLVTSAQSIGVVQWVPVTLEAGTYVAICFFPTAGTGEPHAMKGMHTVFTVAG
jgi:hypothetical protein